jgi:bacillithiol synthase
MSGATPTVETIPLAAGSLTKAALEGSTPSEWYPEVARTAGEWEVRVRRIAEEYTRRNWLEVLEPALQASGNALARLERVSAQGGVVVTTGQQPGLFGGPMYTWCKALAARALADAIEERVGIPAAPVFWAATDDADLLEASSTLVAVRGGFEILRMEIAGAPSGVPLSALPLGDTSAAIEGLLRAAGSGSTAEIIALCQRSYTSQNTVGSAYVALLRGMLEPLEIAVLDASDPSVRGAGDKLLRTALLRAEPIAECLRNRAVSISNAGFRAQVQDVPGRSLVFTFDSQKQRVPVKRAGEVAKTAPVASLSPNVLLRPIMERAILPTAAYIGGPAEVAYFAQVSAVAAALEVPQPMIVPRWSGRIIEPHVARILERLDVMVDELADPHAAATRLAAESLPTEARAALDHLSVAAQHAFQELRGPTRELVPETVLSGAEVQVRHRIDRLARRLRAAVKRQGTAALTDLATARGSLFPNDHPQERALNLLPLFARYGDSLISAMLTEARQYANRLISNG